MPLALARAGAAGILGRRGHRVVERVVEPASGWRAELRTAFELQRLIAAEITAARAAGQVPLVLAGNCNTTNGVLAGVTAPARRLGLVWFDAHGDFNTPEIDPGGFVDGHGLNVHLHIDLDVHDPSIAPANGYAAPDGMSAEEVHEFVRQITDRMPVSSATLAAYDPSYDPERRMERAALDLLTLLAGLLRP